MVRKGLSSDVGGSTKTDGVLTRGGRPETSVGVRDESLPDRVAGHTLVWVRVALLPPPSTFHESHQFRPR